MDIRSFFGGNKASAKKRDPPATSPSRKEPLVVVEEAPLTSGVIMDAGAATPVSPEARANTVIVIDDPPPAVVVADPPPAVVVADPPPADGTNKRRMSSPAKTEHKKQKTESSPRNTATVVSPDAATPSNAPPTAQVPPPQKKFVYGGGGVACAAPGTKPLPDGPEDCLESFVFVLTGVLDSTERDAMIDFIKQHGGRVTSAVSSRTTHLIAGSRLETGRPVESSTKYKQAQQQASCKIVSEDEVIDMVANPAAYVTAKKPKAPTPKKKKKMPVPYAHVASSSSTGAGVTKVNSNQLWADKYKPMRITDLVGNATNIEGLQQWLRKWDAWHVKKTEKPPWQRGKNLGAKAALLSGPPGIGKSSTAAIVAKHLGYEVFELNASDTRSKKSLEEQLNQVVLSTSLVFGKGASCKATKRLVVMDEVDGMSSGDRGGMAELIRVIKLSKTPIVCICNDRQSQKVRSLADKCLDLRFSRPQKTTVAKRMCEVAAREGLDVVPNAMEELVEQSGNDIRQVLNALQMWRQEADSTGRFSKEDGRVKVSFKDMKERMQTVSKDATLRLDPFTCAAQILCPSGRPLNDRINMFFVDYDLMPLLIQQHYLSSVTNCNRDPQLGNLRRMADAASAVSDADLVMTKVRKQQRWDLLTKAAAMNVRVGSISCAPMSGYAGFPEWLGKNSTKSKHKRILRELTSHVGHRVSASSEAMRLDYFGFLRDHVMNPLVDRGKEGVPDAVTAMENYSLTRDDVFESFQSLHLPRPGSKKEILPHERLDSQTKSAFTRYFNKNAKVTPEMLHAVKAGADQEKMLVTKKSVKGTGGNGSDVIKRKKRKGGDGGPSKKKKK